MPVNFFKWKHYEGENYLIKRKMVLKYALSYRNLNEMIQKGE